MTTLSDEEIDGRLQTIRGWERSGNAINRTFTFDDFVGSVDFVNRITPAAQEMNHHPDLSISCNKVTVSLSRHSVGGLTEIDFALATQIDGLA